MDLRKSTRELVILALGHAFSQKSEHLEDWIKYQTRIEKSGFSANDQRIVDGIEVGHILAAISILKPIQKTWTNYCYGPEGSSLHRAELGNWLFWNLHFLQSGKSYAKRLEFCKCVIDDQRLYIAQDRGLPIHVYCHSMEIKPNWEGEFPHWQRDWERKRREGLNILQDMDSDVIGELSMTIKYLRGEQDDGYRPAYVL